MDGRADRLRLRAGFKEVAAGDTGLAGRAHPMPVGQGDEPVSLVLAV
jgi:hypothetical protein